jgi:FG-GAP-like repeat
LKRALISIGLAAIGAALGCTAATSPSAEGPAPTPTPSAGVVARVNPYVVEETDTYTIQRYPKAEYIRVDDRHIRHPILGVEIEFFREDEKYYYVSVPKRIAEEEALRAQQGLQPTKRPADVRRPEESTRPGPPLSDFTDLLPPRAPARLRLEKVNSGLPTEGLWRASFEVADVNEDGILDIVAPPSRIGGIPYLHVWIGDGKGKFTLWKLSYTEAGIDKPDAGLDYGGVAVGDIDGDGHQDIATASHGGGLRSFYGDGKGNFRIVRTGLPGADFSAQAIALLDVSRDKRLDIVASRDVIETTGAVDKQQVRVYVNMGDRWQFHDGLTGGFYSNSLRAWDFDGDGLKDVLTGSHYNGALTLIWKNGGDANFSPVSFPDIEIYAFHFATAPGTFGKDRAPAFADSYYMSTSEPQVAKAGGITLYAFRNGAWTRHRVWRKKDAKTLLYAVAMGDLDGDGLDDVVFPDSEERRLKIFFQKADGSFTEAQQNEEPVLDSPGQCVRLADLDRDGRLDVVLSKTSTSAKPDDLGGWDVYLNRR